MSTPSKDESNVQKALDYYLAEKRQNPDMKVLKVARLFNVDYQRLQRRVHGVGARSTRKGPGRLLTDAQEAELIEYINSHDRPGARPTPQMIKKLANEILLSAHTDTSSPPPVVSKMWPYRFISSRKQLFNKRLFEEFQRDQMEEDTHPLTTRSSSLPTQLRRWTLREKTSGDVILSDDKRTFAVKTVEIPELEPGQILLQTVYLSHDVDLQRQISPLTETTHPFLPSIQISDTVETIGVAEVIASRSPQAPVDSIVTASTGWTDYSVHNMKDVSVVDQIPDLPVTHYLGAFGRPGFTAYYALTEIVKATKKDATVISDAAGPVGSIAVQVAKKMIGCRRVIGIAGSDKECRLVEKLGADVCLDYNSSSYKEQLTKETESFVEIYFDLIGGETLDFMLTRLAKFGRVAAVSDSSQFRPGSEGTTSLKNFSEVANRRLKILGFLGADLIDRLPEVRGILVEAWRRGTLILGEKSEMESVVEVDFDDIPRIWADLNAQQERHMVIKLKDKA
ncbi:quinone oxidoreductase [Aspergillus ustus]|uniref:Quinone oxidoreductase n=1 Tax=Aspergillus ustus TaxID=40382 RepID=A0A0C1BWQ4_ASPUT|nr:quinone oxidoreductase [Aspergillus ustus]